MIHKKISESLEFIANDGTILKELLHPTNDDVKISYSIAHAKIEIGKASLPHQLKSSETYFIIKGQGKMHIDNNSFDVMEKDTFWVPPNANQYLENTGNEILIFLCIVEPYWKAEDDVLS